MSNVQILGLITGVLFGILLQQGRVLRFENQVNALLLKDMTIMKFMLTAIAVGMIGIIPLAHFGVITLSHKAMNLGGIVIGASLFGIGWSVTGLCPGTAVGAIGEGRFHAIFSVVGMLVGAMLFSHSYDFLSKTVLSWKNWGKISLSDVTGVSSMILMPLMVVAIVVVLYIFEKKKL